MAPKCPITNTVGWPDVYLAEITSKIGSGSTPRGGSESYLNTRVNFALIRSQNVLDRSFNRDGLAYITDEQAEGLKGVVLQPGDVLLNITGDGVTFGRACIAPTDVRPACVNQHVSIIRVDPAIADPGYVLSFLTHPEVKSYIESFNAGGSRRAITKGHIESFRLPLPPLNVQRAISHILSTLDDMIELNRQMNETLEAIARALFNSWFVDFDPVRAKAEGRKPTGMDAETAKLFPSELVESALGVVPRGWPIRNWGDLASLEYGKALRGYDKALAGVPVWGTNGRIGFHADALCPHAGIIVGRKGAYRGIHFCDEPFWVIDTAFFMKPRQDLSLRWAYYELQRLDLNGMDSGSAIPSTSRDQFHKLSVCIPPIELQRRFEDALAAAWGKQTAIARESRTLSDVRDALLPRLLSGEISVPAAERAAGRAA